MDLFVCKRSSKGVWRDGQAPRGAGIGLFLSGVWRGRGAHLQRCPLSNPVFSVRASVQEYRALHRGLRESLEPFPARLMFYHLPLLTSERSAADQCQLRSKMEQVTLTSVRAIG
ncbi:hypothetical protein LSM04_009202 [Trypanosoma melophagium]|uniref:uncharacterized protein n=1 Tax=Trypanosoma melophagium TaxID=715481 RepID=UPI003519FB8F|nr:hypothetical protein LSM04_009202 [Trypanosoma melophagium]